MPRTRSLPIAQYFASLHAHRENARLTKRRVCCRALKADPTEVCQDSEPCRLQKPHSRDCVGWHRQFRPNAALCSDLSQIVCFTSETGLGCVPSSAGSRKMAFCGGLLKQITKILGQDPPDFIQLAFREEILHHPEHMLGNSFGVD
jgi:hypothetical protein